MKHHIAFDKDNHRILCFIATEDNINPKEVFSSFENYEYKVTKIVPPYVDYNQYEVIIENEEITGYKLIGGETIEGDN